MSTPHRTAALIVAAGRGRRAGGAVAKQWQPLGGAPLVLHAARAFASHPRIRDVVVVVPPGEEGRLPGFRCVAGGATRAASVRAGLDALAGGIRDVLIHDGARPLVPQGVIDAVLDALVTHEAAAPGLPVVDALWRAEDGLVTGEVPREGLWRAQTPQGFRLAAIRAAHAAAPADAPDDVAVARARGIPVHIVTGHQDNLKVTHPEDFTRAGRILNDRRGTVDLRLGHGYDVHRFGEGDHVMLCGVRVPFGRALQGHSDADVGLHALADAIYGGLGDGDIGQHFPPSEARWKGEESDTFLAHAASRAAERGFRIGNLDVTLVCERPKIGPYAARMRARVAEIAGIEDDRVSVKATTSERLGFTGREEGIAALATAALIGGAA